jgi:hypothetical protein
MNASDHLAKSSGGHHRAGVFAKLAKPWNRYSPADNGGMLVDDREWRLSLRMAGRLGSAMGTRVGRLTLGDARYTCRSGPGSQPPHVQGFASDRRPALTLLKLGRREGGEGVKEVLSAPPATSFAGFTGIAADASEKWRALLCPQLAARQHHHVISSLSADLL